LPLSAKGSFWRNVRATNTEKVFNAIKGGLAGSTVMKTRTPMILDGNFKPGFKIDLHIKDLDNAHGTGYSTGMPLPLTVEAMQTVKVKVTTARS
jgi:2-hydroxy-3-oxopropionate reductase